MSFPRYPKYKDSGVEWLGEVPEHWATNALKRLAQIRYGIGEPPAYHPEGTPLIRATNVHNGRIDPSGVVFVNPDEIPSQRILWLDAGDIVVVRSGAYTGDSATVPADFGPCIAGFDMVLRCHGANPAFIQFALLSSYMKDGQIALHRMRAAQPHLNAEELGQCVVTMPDLPEQAAIATFLDREIAKIDALIAEQQRLIELLQEKRQAVISHAVTKGLNPDAPMKDSGIEWLGEVPVHWKVAPLKQIVSTPITDGPHETPAFLDDGVPFVSAEAVSSGRIDFAKVRGCISQEDNARYSLKYSPQRNDIYMVKSGATTGVTAIVEDRTDFNIWSPLAAIRCGEVAAPYFVLNFMRSRNFQEAVTLNWSYGTQQNIGMGVIENLPCVLPPIPEQHAMIAYLNRFDDAATPLVCDAERAITLLQERRSALISAAVTGQIDVRGLAGSEAA